MNTTYGYGKTKRILDIIIGVISLIVFIVPMIIIGILIKFTSKGPVIHWAKRVGKNNDVFMMAKFRTMRADTPIQDINTLSNPDSYFVPLGSFLRKTGIDEMPQIYNVLKGNMSFVGPRPVLYNHSDVIELRNEKGINKILPGLTGLAQVKGENHVSAVNRVRYDEFYMNNLTLLLDLRIIMLTVLHLFENNIQIASKLNKKPAQEI